jgi:hypothetical protein
MEDLTMGVKLPKLVGRHRENAGLTDIGSRHACSGLSDSQLLAIVWPSALTEGSSPSDASPVPRFPESRRDAGLPVSELSAPARPSAKSRPVS